MDRAKFSAITFLIIVLTILGLFIWSIVSEIKNIKNNSNCYYIPENTNDSCSHIIHDTCGKDLSSCESGIQYECARNVKKICEVGK